MYPLRPLLFLFCIGILFIFPTITLAQKRESAIAPPGRVATHRNGGP